MSVRDAYIVCLVEKSGYRTYHVSSEGVPKLAVRDALYRLTVEDARNVKEARVVAIEDMKQVEVPPL